MSSANEEGTLLWRLEHAVVPPAVAPLMSEVINTLKAIEAEANEEGTGRAERIKFWIREGVKG